MIVVAILAFVKNYLPCLMAPILEVLELSPYFLQDTLGVWF